MIDQLIDKYIQLRDRKSDLKEKYEVAVSQIDDAMEKVEAVILAHLNANNIDSVAGTTGTAFKQSVTSATVQSRDGFLDFVRANQAWFLLDVRANKTAVADYKRTNNDLPPGINWREELVVRIRRPNKDKTETV